MNALPSAPDLKRKPKGIIGKWNLGGPRCPRGLLRAIYGSHAVEQRPIGSIQKSFTPADWKYEIGNQEFYASYLDFFSHEVPKLGRMEAIVKYTFDTDVIGRMFSGAFHPLIHLGCGVDFGIDATVVAPATMVDKVAAKIQSLRLLVQ
ncbi:hypothetical protein BGZ79_007237 [Entomortierella chlamydospora]|nr:hypothetical protein BGZ79_007237 [Entomortierella chlamydospora]